MKQTIKTIAMLALVLGSTQAIAQNAAINSTGTAPDASAMLDVSSTTKGLLTPRMTAAQRGAIASPATGLIVYQTDGTDGFYYYDGSSWILLINNVDALPAVDGSAVTNLNASNLASGTVPSARLGSGTADNTTYLRGDGTWNTPSGGSSPTFTSLSGQGTSFTMTGTISDVGTFTMASNGVVTIILATDGTTNSVRAVAITDNSNNIIADNYFGGVGIQSGMANGVVGFTAVLAAGTYKVRAACNASVASGTFSVRKIEF